MRATDRVSETVRVFVSAGSNIEPRAHLEAACAALNKRYPDLELSPVYESPAEGFSGPPFLNLVVSFRTDETPEEILRVLAEREALAGRDRSGGKFASRTLDLDLLLYGDCVNEALKLPHPDIDRYTFVLKPLADLAPNLRHPVTGATMSQTRASLAGPHRLRKVPPLFLPGQSSRGYSQAAMASR